jgi:hypothetical protein
VKAILIQVLGRRITYAPTEIDAFVVFLKRITALNS